MRLSHRIAIGCFVGLFFAAGYAARQTCSPARSTGVAFARRSLVSAPGTTVAALGGVGAGTVDFRPLETLIFVVNSLRQHFVEQITEETEGKMTHEALRSMLASLDDPNTRFVEPDETRCIEESAQGKFHGIGVALGIQRVKTGDITEEHLIVVTPVASGPAANAGVMPGDDIVALDGKDVLPFDPYQRARAIAKAAMNRKGESPDYQKRLDAEKKRIEGGVTIYDAEKRLILKDDKEVELSIARTGSAKTVKVKITPKQFTVDPVAGSVMGAGKIGYLKVQCLSQDTSDRLAEALARVQSEGAKGLVLDLRNVAGGQVEWVTQMAQVFAPGKKLATLFQSRGRKAAVAIPSSSTDQIWKGPMVVLVNRGTARMAEVLAAGLKENRVAKLVGEKTYGDLSYSVVSELRDGSAISLTTGVFAGVNGAQYNGKGVPVDVKVAPTGAGDPQLEAAVKLASSEAGRS